jgi:deoxyribose-phosphate aldolase
MSNIAGMIDHTLLKPDSVLGDYTTLVRQAVEHSFRSVCVHPFFVPLVSNLVNAYPLSKVEICSVISFPHGLSDIHTKSLEIERALSKGASEVDVVLNLAATKSHDWNRVKTELVELREASDRHVLKIILEVAALTKEEIIEVSKICLDKNVDFLKTATGYYNVKLEPAKTAEYVALLKDLTNGTRCKVKASGGIRSLADVNLMIDAGASRIGTSNSIEIMGELRDGKI